MRKRRYYVTVYDATYSMNRKDFMQFLEDGANMSEDGWSLSNYDSTKLLKRRVSVYEEQIKPLDWQREDFQYELERFTKSAQA